MPEHSVTILCSNVDRTITNIVCDLPIGHRGPHKATILWGDEGSYDPYADPTHGERNDAD